jgi:hypothetical protein
MGLSRFASAVSALLLTSVLALTGAAPAHAAGPATWRSVTPTRRASAPAATTPRPATAAGAPGPIPRCGPAAHAPSSFAFTACSGATTSDVVSTQLGPLTSATGLVSITVGGNDAGFGDVMSTCVLH